MNYKISRSVARAWQTELPVGDAFSGPAYAGRTWAASKPGHRDVVEDIVEGVGDAVDSVVESPLGQLAAGAVGFVFGGPLGAALAVGGLSLASGADPLKALLAGGLTYAGASFFGGAGGGEAAGGAISEGGAATLAGEAGAASGAETMASAIGGTPTSAGEFLVASAPQSSATMTDVMPGLIERAADNAVAAGAGPLADASSITGFGGGMDTAAIAGTNFGAPAGAASSGGIIDSVMKWGKENPLLAVGAMQVGGGIVSGIGQNAMLDKKIAAEKEMQQQKLQDQIALEEWKRRFIQGGAVASGKVPFAPGADQTLRRPDGSAVYSNPGIVLGAMNG